MSDKLEPEVEREIEEEAKRLWLNRDGHSALRAQRLAGRAEERTKWEKRAVVVAYP